MPAPPWCSPLPAARGICRALPGRADRASQTRSCLGSRAMCHKTLKGRALLKSHGLSEAPIVWRNTSVTFTRDDEDIRGWWSKKWGAIRGKKLHGNREIVVEWTVGIVGAQGQLTQGPDVPNPRTKYKRSKKCFCCHFYYAHHWLRFATIGKASCAVSKESPGTPGGKTAIKTRGFNNLWENGH